MNSSIYLKGLNGIRAIASIGVLFSHTNLALKDFKISQYSLFGFNDKGHQLSYKLGSHGVTMFFVLSGFLITYLLLKEINKNNKIEIKAFYLRRILRIWPLYFLYFGLCMLFLYVFKDNIPANSTIFYYLFFLANIPFVTGTANHLFAHLWSVSVEEQFYLFWPFLFRFKKNLIKILVSLIIIQGAFRIIIWLFFPFSVIANLSNTNRFDCMMIGGLGAILLYKNSFIIKYLNNKIVQSICWITMLTIILNYFKVVNFAIEFWIVSIMTLAIIIGQVLDKNKIINLENKVFNFFGILSFGIYVYHPLVIYLLNKSNLMLTINNELTRVVFTFILVFFITVAVSWISYNFIELQFLKLKGKYQVVKSTNKG